MTAVALVAATPRPSRRRVPISAVVLPIVFFGVFLGVWELYVSVADVQVLLLPAPSDIASRTVEDFGLLLDLAWNTAKEAFWGVAIGSLLGIGLAVLAHPVRWLNRGLLSYSSTIKALPIVALYPVMTVFFGISTKAVIAMVAFAVGPVMLTFASRGFSGTSEHDELMKSIAASRTMRFRSLVLPRSFPYLMTGLRTIAPLSIIIAIVSEYFGGSITTLGSYIRRESANLHTVNMWSAIVMSCALGIMSNVLVSLLDRVLVHRRPRRS